jgi:hypothetical protein
MLIVKNFFSFYIELEVLLHLVFDFRYWSQNKDDNMMNETQSEMNWIAQRNQVKINSWIKLWTVILRIAYRNPEKCFLPALFRQISRIIDRNY